MKTIGVGILGFGTVGAGVAKGLLENKSLIAERTGLDIRLVRVADLDTTTDRGVTLPDGTLISDAFSAVADPAVDIVVELIGGTGVAKKLVLAAIEAGKPVVTANKKLLAESGEEIFAKAQEKGVDIFFGASVGGGIPVIRSLRDGLAGAKIEKVYGILNGTCNYILTAMEKDGLPFDDVLRTAQKLGFAEANPTLDVDGFDTLHKAAIIASLAYGIRPDLSKAPLQGIRGTLDAEDIALAREFGFRIKLLAIIKHAEDGLEFRVAPTLVPAEGMLGSVSGVFNAAMVKSDMDDWTLYYGRGAGRLPTATTVIGDIAEAARNIAAGTHRPVTMPTASTPIAFKAGNDFVSRFYTRLTLRDEPGSLAAAMARLAAHGVSVRSASQRGDAKDGNATVVVFTHDARKADLDAALSEIAALSVSGAEPRALAIEDRFE